MNGFAVLIVFLFACAACVEFISGNYIKGWFYAFSSGINLVVMFLR